MAVDADPAAEWGEPGPLMATDDGDERDDRPRSPHSAGSMPMERIPTSGSIDRGESDLSVLEHIFIYSKSEHREHRCVGAMSCMSHLRGLGLGLRSC